MPSDASQPPASAPAGPELARSVADELGPIFAAHAVSATDADERESRVRAMGPGARRRTIPVTALGAVLAASIAGLSIGTALAHRTHPRAPTAVAPAPAGPPIVVAAAAPPALPLPRSLVQVAPAPQMAATAPVKAKPAPKLRHVSAPRRHAPVHRIAARGPDCGGLDRYERAWCGHRAVMDADDRLRRAYDEAVRAGVSRSVLISYRDRWSRLRRRAGSAPDEVVAGYGAMAGDLSRMADRRRRLGGRHAERWWGWG